MGRNVDRYHYAVERTALYRHFDSDGRLLYVGITNSAVARINQHMKTARWAEDIRSVEIEWFETRADAIDAEDRAIASENPVFNIRGQASANAMPQPCTSYDKEYIRLSAESAMRALEAGCVTDCEIRVYKNKIGLRGSVSLGIRFLLAQGKIRKCKNAMGFSGHTIANDNAPPIANAS